MFCGLDQAEYFLVMLKDRVLGVVFDFVDQSEVPALTNLLNSLVQLSHMIIHEKVDLKELDDLAYH